MRNSSNIFLDVHYIIFLIFCTLGLAYDILSINIQKYVVILDMHLIHKAITCQKGDFMHYGGFTKDERFYFNRHIDENIINHF